MTSQARTTPDWTGISSAARELIELLSPEEAGELLQKIRASDEARAEQQRETAKAHESDTDGFMGVRLPQ